MSKQIGALWAKNYDKDGEEKQFMSGVIDLGVLGEINIAVFSNDNKKDPRHPDYNVVLSKNNGRGESNKEDASDMKPF